MKMSNKAKKGMLSVMNQIYAEEIDKQRKFKCQWCDNIVMEDDAAEHVAQHHYDSIVQDPGIWEEDLDEVQE